tara:strand:- start:3052 stop:3279 length:228 start_codon:yes stop_codon:yes gene_type:complete
MAGRSKIDKTYSALKRSEKALLKALDTFTHEYAKMINPKLPHKIERPTLERKVGALVGDYFDNREGANLMERLES